MCPPNCWDQVEPVVSSYGHLQETGLPGICCSTTNEQVCGSTLLRTIQKPSTVCCSPQMQYDIRPPLPTHFDTQHSDVTIKQLPLSDCKTLPHRTEPKLRTLLQPFGLGGRLRYVLDFRDSVLPGGKGNHPNDSKAEGTQQAKQSGLIKHFPHSSEFGHQSKQPERVLGSLCPGVCLDCNKRPPSHTCRNLSTWDSCRIYFMTVLLFLSLCLPLSSGLCSRHYRTIRCPYGQSVVIVNATYGSDGRQCGAERDNVMTCNNRLIRQDLTNLCTGRTSCDIKPYRDLRCQVVNGTLDLNFACLSGGHFITLDGRTTTVLRDSNMTSGYLLFDPNENPVNSSLIYELHLNLSHSFHVDLSPLSFDHAFSDCDNFKVTTFSPLGKTTLCGDKSRLNMQIMNSSVTTVVFHFSVHSRQEVLLPFLVSSCDLSDITLNSYDDLVINVVERTLEVSCREGYRRTTTDVTVCNNGTWAGNVSVCEAIMCPVLGTIPHGQVLVLHRNWKSVAKYSCLRRYTLTGAERRRCQSDGTWSGNPPACTRAFCLPPSVPSPATFSPNDTKDHDVGASVTVACPLGSQLIGQDVLTCLTNSSWSHPSPSCEIVDCGDPMTLNNSVQNYSLTTYGSKVKYTCKSSDEFQSEDQVTCRETGRWSDTSLTCPQMLPVQSQSMCSGDLITIDCPSGEMVVVVNASYGIQGDNACNATSGDSTTCSSRWTTQVLTTLCTGKSSCSIRPSTDLQGPLCQVADAQLDFNFTCVSSDHFVKTENGTSVLSDSISWGCLLPSAKESSALESEPLPKAQVDVRQINKSVYLDFAAVNSLPLVENCDSLDLTLKSPSGDITFCKEEIKNLNVIFVDSSVMTLEIRWSTPSGNDTRIVVPFLVTECEPKVDVVGGNNLLSVDIGKQRLETICPEGYFKPQKSVCVGGEWLGNDSPCQPVSCPSLGTIPNGQLQLTGKTYKNIAKYSCLRKFQLVGNSERACQYTGIWSGSTPSCRRIFCPAPFRPRRGWYTPNRTQSFDVDTSVNFRCQTGTILIGQPVITCTSNSTWSRDAPICRVVDCGIPPQPSSTTVTFSSTDYNSEAKYSCNINRNVTSVIRCTEDGHWTSPNASCPLPTTTVKTTSTTVLSAVTAKPVVDDEDDDGDFEDDDLSLGVILGIAFGAVGFILLLSIIACVLCSFSTKRWRRTQLVTNVSDIVADSHVTDIRESAVTNVYIIRNNNDVYHQRSAPGFVGTESHLASNEGRMQKNYSVHAAKAPPPERPKGPKQMGNGFSSSHKLKEIPQHLSQSPHDSVVVLHNPKIRANGHNVIQLNSTNHYNKQMNGTNHKHHTLPLDANNAQSHTFHSTHL